MLVSSDVVRWTDAFGKQVGVGHSTPLHFPALHFTSLSGVVFGSLGVLCGSLVLVRVVTLGFT